ncbi:probable cytochrome P450 318a1 [Lucilia sericata]|uniref:probable cytochrome P450 318a1 n=1 Tax=Lucilia sericata TaxID=13632 RepID=UPI0018A8440E|nr:probable cytochrome P450 318a1 [Lucilia sericata]
MNSLLFYTISVICLIIYKQRKCWYFIWQLNGWRGLLQQPILWLLLIIYLEPKSIMSSIQRCHKYFQFPLAIIVFNRILLYVDDPETMESILTAPECLNKTFLQNGFYANKGLLHAKDEQWKIRRKQLNPAFSHNTLVSFFEIFNRVSNELKVKISKDLLDCKEVKFKSFEDLITRAVLEVSCLTTMGFETNFLQNDEKFIAQSYRYLMELTALRILKPWYQIDFIFRLLDNENYEKSKRANKLVKEFVANIVQQKHIEWQHRLELHRQKADIKNTTSNVATATNTRQATEENVENHNFTGKRTAAAVNDALKNNMEEFSSLPESDANVFMQEQQKHRIFIDQIFYLAQTGKLALEDIMNESQSMVVVSFETVSSCIINALLCLAINHECQMKLRYEIQQVLLLSKNKTNNKTKMTTAAAATTSIKHINDTNATTTNTKTNYHETCANTIDGDLDFNTTDCEGDVNNDDIRSSNFATSSSGSNTRSSNSGNGSSGYNDSLDSDDDENEMLNDCDVKVTIEHLLNMPYLDMIINESLRLLTTVPMNLRNASADFQLNVIQRDKCTCALSNNKNTSTSCSCRHVVVPKDTMIALDIFNMQRNEKYWGANALKFYPENFSKKHQPQQQYRNEEKIEDENEMKLHETSISSSAGVVATSRHSYAFVPFSKGLRTCIGYRYSIYLSKIVLIKLISSFEFTTNIKLEDLQCYEGVSLKFSNADKINFQIKPVG